MATWNLTFKQVKIDKDVNELQVKVVINDSFLFLGELDDRARKEIKDILIEGVNEKCLEIAQRNKNEMDNVNDH